jgi:hypothetical protein
VLAVCLIPARYWGVCTSMLSLGICTIVLIRLPISRFLILVHQFLKPELILWD